MNERTDIEALAEDLLVCECGHSLDEHNGLGCYARIAYTPLVKCDCPLTDDRTYAELLAPRLAAREAAAAGRALREAADALDDHSVCSCEPDNHVGFVAGSDWLRDRAAQVAPSRVPSEES